MIDAITEIFCIIGNPVTHSLSPQMHNAGYKALGLNFKFVAFNVINLHAAIQGIRSLGIRGVSVTIPHKTEAMKYVDEIDEVAKKIGAINTIINQKGKLKATNTDWIGALRALEEKTTLAHKKIVVSGAGGAARALLYGLTHRKAKVYIMNRTLSKAQNLSVEFHLEGILTDKECARVQDADILINTTPLGIHSDDALPFPTEIIRDGQIVFDAVYTPKDTKLLRIAKQNRATVVYGYKMLLYQAMEQFKLFTGFDAPLDIFEHTLLQSLHV